MAVKKLRRKIGKGTVLEFEFGGAEIAEGKTGDRLTDWLLRSHLIMWRDVIDSIVLASQDPAVIGLIGTFKGELPPNIGLAQIQVRT